MEGLLLEASEREDSRRPLGALALAAAWSLCLVLAFHFAVGDVGLSLADEGFLWYGVEHTSLGQVPLRDFQAYDPGRYYWCAALAPVFGGGLMGLRLAASLFLAVGLFLGMLVLRRLVRQPLAWMSLGALLFLWCFPRHKVFEHALVLAAVWSATRLVERPTARRHFESGVFLGLAGVMGRNHALYGVLIFGALFALLAWRRHGDPVWKRFLGAFVGVKVGYLPVLGMLLFVPGYWDALLESVRIILKHGANLPRPYPWPDPQAWSGLSGLELFARLGHDAAFLLPPVLLPVGLFLALRTRGEELGRRAVLIAASFVGAVYFHHAWVRSDPPHLAQMIPPVLLLGWALPELARSGRARVVARALGWITLAAVTVGMTFESHTTLARFRPGSNVRLAAFDVAGETLRLPPGQGLYLRSIVSAVTQNVRPEEALLIAPTRPTLYSVLDKDAPIWWIYFFWNAEPEEERVFIEELRAKGVNWVLLADLAIDDRDELRFGSTNPLLAGHLAEDFRVVARPAPGHTLLRRKER